VRQLQQCHFQQYRDGNAVLHVEAADELDKLDQKDDPCEREQNGGAAQQESPADVKRKGGGEMG
jgi:hypothetical protein